MSCEAKLILKTTLAIYTRPVHRAKRDPILYRRFEDGTKMLGLDKIFAPDREWLVDTRAFASRGKNTLLAGSTLKGKVMAIIFQGKPVYEDDAVKIKVI